MEVKTHKFTEGTKIDLGEASQNQSAKVKTAYLYY